MLCQVSLLQSDYFAALSFHTVLSLEAGLYVKPTFREGGVMLLSLRAECQHKLFRILLQRRFDPPSAPILSEGGHSLTFGLCKMFQAHFVYFFPSSRIGHFTKKSEFLLLKKGITNKFWLLRVIIATAWHCFLADREKVYMWAY